MILLGVYLCGVMAMAALCGYLHVSRRWFVDTLVDGLDGLHVVPLCVFWPAGALILTGRLLVELTIARAKRLQEQKRLAAIELSRAMDEVERMMRAEAP